MTEQSEELTRFYQSYQQWLDAGAPQKAPYSRLAGLCFAVKTFRMLTKDSPNYIGLSWEMAKQFELAELPKDYPFNGYEHRYSREAGIGECHLNTKRIKWVKDHCNV